MPDETRIANLHNAPDDGAPIRTERRRRGNAAVENAPRPERAKSASKRTRRVHYQLDEELCKRLGVHCELSGRSPKDVIERVMGAWLRANGKGRELWGSSEGASGVVPDDSEDRQDRPAA